MITWLNVNQGFVMCLLTFVYVLATIAIVVMNNMTIKEMKEARAAESRPYVFVSLHKDPRDVCFYLRVKNHGKTGAIINRLQITPTIKLVDIEEKSNFLERSILAPNQTLQFIVLEKWEETCEKDYNVEIEYTMVGDANSSFHEQYALVVQYAHQMGYTDRSNSNLSNSENSLKSIAEHLDSIRSKL
jgi:hypothetical protein